MAPWKTMAMRLQRTPLPERLVGEAADVLAGQAHRAAQQRGVARQQAHERERQAGLAAPGFADDAQRLTLGDVEGDAVHGPQRPSRGGVLEAQVADLQQRRQGGCIGIRAAAAG